jgi:DNA-binding transcriptional regulator LsrR (DeoR family)
MAGSRAEEEAVGLDGLFQRAVIARRYYLDGRTRVEIAEEFGLSRFKVARILEEALESGMVEITIHDPGSIDVELSTALQERYALQHAYAVAAGSKDTNDRAEAVAKAMAELLQSILHDGDVIGVDCGRTITRIPRYLTTLPRCDVVQLTGLAGGLTSNGADLTRRISEVTGGGSWPLYAPYVVADARTAASLASTPQIAAAVANHSRITCALVSVGGWSREASQVYTSVSEDEASALYRAGVRAETCGLLLDAQGNRVCGLDERRMGITEDGLRDIPTVVAISAGAEKIDATRAVLRSGLISGVVTDTEIAAAVLD